LRYGISEAQWNGHRHRSELGGCAGCWPQLQLLILLPIFWRLLLVVRFEATMAAVVVAWRWRGPAPHEPPQLALGVEMQLPHDTRDCLGLELLVMKTARMRMVVSLAAAGLLKGMLTASALRGQPPGLAPQAGTSALK
jgi:hypothetical protein